MSSTVPVTEDLLTTRSSCSANSPLPVTPTVLIVEDRDTMLPLPTVSLDRDVMLPPRVRLHPLTLSRATLLPKTPPRSAEPSEKETDPVPSEVRDVTLVRLRPLGMVSEARLVTLILATGWVTAVDPTESRVGEEGAVYDSDAPDTRSSSPFSSTVPIIIIRPQQIKENSSVSPLRPLLH